MNFYSTTCNTFVKKLIKLQICLLFHKFPVTLAITAEAQAPKVHHTLRHHSFYICAPNSNTHSVGTTKALGEEPITNPMMHSCINTDLYMCFMHMCLCVHAPARTCAIKHNNLFTLLKIQLLIKFKFSILNLWLLFIIMQKRM